MSWLVRYRHWRNHAASESPIARAHEIRIVDQAGRVLRSWRVDTGPPLFGGLLP